MRTTKASISVSKVLLFVIFLFAISSQAYAAGAYNEYLADLYLHESHQARNPEYVIKYTDAQNGQLLQEVLKPNRFAIALDQYYEATKRGSNVPNLFQITSPMLTRYGDAFDKNPKVYEPEYLDSLEILVILVSSTRSMLNHQQNAVPASNVSIAKTEAENKALNDSLQKLSSTVYKMNMAIHRVVANGIRKKVDAKMFSEEGAKRALRIADKLSPP